jgi:hypothetical protein
MIGAEITIQLAAMRLLSGLIIAAVHGATLAAVGVLLGDKGPRHDGRLTAMPFGHVDLVGLASMVLGGFGWSKPVALDPAHMRFGRWGVVLTVLAGSLALLLLGWLLLQLVVPALTLLPHTPALVVAAFLRTASRLCVWAAIFALVPLPPLAGAHFLAILGIRLPQAAGLVIGWVLLVASLLGVTRIALAPIYNLIAPLLLGAQVAAG